MAELGEGLSRKEEEIVLAVAQHHCLRRVAETLHLSLDTVKTHLQRIYKKIGCHRRDHFITWCIESGRVSLECLEEWQRASASEQASELVKQRAGVQARAGRAPRKPGGR